MRGMCKSSGDFIRKCDAQGLHRHPDYVPTSQLWKFAPMLERLDAFADSIVQYDWKIRDYADAHFQNEVALQQTIPGVELVTSCAFVALTPNPKKFGASTRADAVVIALRYRLIQSLKA